VGTLPAAFLEALAQPRQSALRLHSHAVICVVHGAACEVEEARVLDHAVVAVVVGMFVSLRRQRRAVTARGDRQQ
jgi:hypothetical protein